MVFTPRRNPVGKTQGWICSGETPTGGCVTAEGLLCQRCPQPFFGSTMVDESRRYMYSKSFFRNKHGLYSPWESCRKNTRMDLQWRDTYRWLCHCRGSPVPAVSTATFLYRSCRSGFKIYVFHIVCSICMCTALSVGILRRKNTH
jgi:hypothetical protein